jgi:flagellar biosynthesis protein FlhF
MKIKKFIARSFQAGKIQIASELGDDAVILSSRTSRGPEGDSIIEIVAAVDENKSEKGGSATPAKRPLKDKIANIENILSGVVKNDDTQDESKPVRAYKDLQSSDIILRKVESIERSVQEINDTLKYKHSADLHPVLSELYKKLIDSEFEENEVLEAITKIRFNASDPDPDKAENNIYRELLKHISIGKPLTKKDNGTSTVVAVVGTTGNGKTSTLVKLALVSKLVEDANCLLVSADKHKVGGTDQLRTYASIADMDFRTAYTSEEVRHVLMEKNKYDYVFFDTSGKSQNDNKSMLEISDMIKAISPDRTLLVLSTGLSKHTAEDIISKYSIVPLTDIVLTKLDEASRLGGPVTALKKANAPLTYISYGQSIPDDIYPASTNALNRLLAKAGKTIRDYEEIFEGSDN